MEIKKVRSFYSLEQHWQSLLDLFFTFEHSNIELAYELMKSQGLSQTDLNNVLLDCGYFKLLTYENHAPFPVPYYGIASSEAYIKCAPFWNFDDARIGLPDFWPECLNKSQTWTFDKIYNYFEAQPLDLSSLKISNSVKRLLFVIKNDSELILPLNIPDNVLYFDISNSSQFYFRIFCENLDETKEKYPNIRFDKRFFQKPKPPTDEKKVHF